VIQLPEDVLLVEDNMLIALGAEDSLLELGVKSVRISTSVHHALDLIAEKAPAFTFVDVNLGDESGFAVAHRLLQLGLTFAFMTGYGDDIAPSAAYEHIRVVRKPYSREDLLQALSEHGSQPQARREGCPQ
jgi:CheY-like chemotaxis protein